MIVYRVVRVFVAACLISLSGFVAAGAGVLGSGGLPALIERVKPSVVLVGTFLETDSPRFTFRGSGFVVASGNLAVTNVHVLPDASTSGTGRQLMIQVRREGGHWMPRKAEIVALDAAHDVALLRFEGEPVAPLVLAGDHVAKEGREVALIGFPLAGALGFSPVTHRGIISAITSITLPPPSAKNLNARSIRQLRDGSFDIFQLDAVAYPGNSGGALLDVMTGEVVGVINMVYVKGGHETVLSQPSGITYAVPIVHVRALLSNN